MHWLLFVLEREGKVCSAEHQSKLIMNLLELYVSV